MFKIPIQEDRNAEMLKARNELMHTTNQNCASPSSREDKQKPSLVEGQRVAKCVPAQAHKWGGVWT